MPELIVTIDGPAAVGKSTAAILLAKKLGAAFLDTGATYRAVTLAAMERNIDLTNPDQLSAMLETTSFEFSNAGDVMKITIDNIDVTEDIRDPEVTGKVKFVAPLPEVRARLVRMQRTFAGQYERIVTEGRDQGTVVFPEADFKFFLTADKEERARRRKSDLTRIGQSQSLERTQQDIQKRDSSDLKRTVSPLIPAAEAVVIDTTELTAEETVDKMLIYIKSGRRRDTTEPNTKQ
jgi:cytidylate kinase